MSEPLFLQVGNVVIPIANVAALEPSLPVHPGGELTVTVWLRSTVIKPGGRYANDCYEVRGHHATELLRTVGALVARPPAG